MNDTHNKYYFSESYPMIEDNITEIIEDKKIESKELKSNDILLDLVYMPWQVINENKLIREKKV